MRAGKALLPAAMEAQEMHRSGSYGSSQGGYSRFHYVNLNKWYWKALIIAVLCLVLFTVLSIVGGIFAILFRFATPILIVLLVVSLLRNMRGR